MVSLDPVLSEAERKKELASKLKLMSSDQEEHIAEVRAQEAGLPYISLVTFPIDSDVLELVSKTRARETDAVLFYHQGKDVRVGAVEPRSEKVQELMKDLIKKFGAAPVLYLISRRSLAACLARYRREAPQEAVLEGELSVNANEVTLAGEAVKNLEELGARITSLPPSQILQAVVVNATIMGASDIHIEPKEKNARLRFRVDGVLQDITNFARDGWSLLLSRIKVLSRLKLNVHETPQDGSFVLRLPLGTAGEENIYDIRVSILPGGWGETIVMRLLSRKMEAVSITDLGMKERDFQLVQAELKRANGMILVTGPTGSGKTTTLASFIKAVNTPELKIITLEDPIEYRLPGVQQTQIDHAAGYTFAKGLRSILRQDPDMILLGEMRDEETAETAVHAALTGHLVFSTLHTNNAAGAIPRLVNMGAKPYVLAPALNLIIAQRLVRKVCPKCAEEYKPDAAIKERIAEVMAGVRTDVFDPSRLKNKKLTILKAVGCKACVNGYKGRVGAFEIFAVDNNIKELMIEGANEFRVQEAALKQGMTTITQDGFIKVLDHVTSLEEIERIAEE
ncbi:MAG: type II/IV secretion system protein [Candidatus Andersenbacteria bacterium]|nr:type II/IV secretion system protein [Candidatus Andersenbacteria bacterium]MBI3250779.1 type II/IV secretion system protein [Candidatus Andersenbacteria bacterium]